MAAFTVSLQQLADKSKGDIQKIAQKVTLDLFAKILERSPVGNPALWKSPPPKGYIGGQFRANWNCAFNLVDASTTDSTNQSRGADEAAKALSFPVGGVVYYTNSLPYAQRLEYDSWSSQAIPGMVRISVAEFDQYVRAAVNSK